MNNICDDNNDNIMDFLIRDEDDEFTEAIVLIVDNLAKEAANGGDDTTVVPPFVWGSGSCVGKAPSIERCRVFHSHLLFDDFWGPSPIYNANYFKKFFKMPIGLFDDIVAKVTANDDYFRQKTDAVGTLGLSSLQKVCTAIRQLTSGVSQLGRTR
jgi:hypothetical protein